MHKIIPNGEPEVPTIMFFTGHSIVSLKNGDQLFDTDTETIDLPPGKEGFASLITFTGGTGSMANATGQIRLPGDFNLVEGATTGMIREKSALRSSSKNKSGSKICFEPQWMWVVTR